MADRSVSAGGDIDRSVVVSGDGNAVALSFGSEFKIPLFRRQFRANERRRRPRELDILDPTRGGLSVIGRESEIENLEKWLNADPDISVHALIGLAGAGKTRLAIELCSRIDNGKAPGDQGWVAGFLSPTELPELAGAYALYEYGWENSTLLVIDYAAQHYKELARWLDQLAVQSLDEGVRLRILLLERTAPEDFGWWRELTGSKLGSSRERLDLFWDESLRPETLLGLEDLEVRRQIVSAALLAAKQFHGDEGATEEVLKVGEDAAFDAELSKPVFANPLSLVMAGMIARESSPTAALSLRRLDAARHLASRELERLQRLGAEVDDKSVVHVAAFNVLVGGLPLEGLTNAIGAELNSAGLSGDPDAIADLFQQEFPVSGSEDAEAAQPKLGTIQPDLIAEGAVVEAFEKASPAYRDQGPAFIQRAYEVGKETAAAAIIRLLQDYAFALEDVSAGEEEKLTAQRLLGWLNSLADGLQEPEALEPLAFALPSQTLVLREDALKITSRLAEHWMALFSESKGMNTAYRAIVWANNHSLRLSELGKHDDALRVAETASNLARLLFDIDADAFRDDLAGSLNNLAAMLSDLGRLEDALAAAEEAVELYRTLAAARPDAFIPNLAMSLSNLAGMLSAVGRREDALAAAEEAVELYRTLAAARPDAFIPNLAGSLNNLANMLSDLGRLEDAHAAAEEAVELYRTLAAARPDAFIPNLAGSLNNLANRLSDLGRREDALAAAEEAVELYRTLAAARPDAFIPDLAGSLNNLAGMLSDLGRLEDALAAAEEAAELYWTLAAARPDAFIPDLAMSLSNLAGMLSAVGRREDALAAAEEAVELYRTLAAARPDAFIPNLAMSLSNLAAMLSDLGRREDALAAAEEAVELYRTLAAARPDAFIPDLAGSLNNLAAILSDLGRLEDALAAAEEAVELRRTLAAARPDAFIPDLAMSLNNLAGMLSDLGRLEDALAAAEEAVELYRTLAAARPDAFIPNLAGSLNNLAGMLSSLGRREDALAAAEEAVELRRTLAAARPDAASVDLSTSLAMISDIKNACGDKLGAFEAISEAIDVLRPVFLELPQAVDRWMFMYMQRYFTLAEELELQPDMTKVGPILEMLEALKRELDDETGNGDRSVKAGNIVGSQVITGDKNTAIMKGIKVKWPQAENVSIADEIAALKADLASLRSPEQSKLERALEDASEEAIKVEPDKDEIGGAIERVIKYAKKADDLSSQAEKLAPRFAAIIAWLGPAWTKLAGMIGLGA